MATPLLADPPWILAPLPTLIYPAIASRDAWASPCSPRPKPPLNREMDQNWVSRSRADFAMDPHLTSIAITKFLQLLSARSKPSRKADHFASRPEPQTLTVIVFATTTAATARLVVAQQQHEPPAVFPDVLLVLPLAHGGSRRRIGTGDAQPPSHDGLWRPHADGRARPALSLPRHLASGDERALAQRQPPGPSSAFVLGIASTARRILFLPRRPPPVSDIPDNPPHPTRDHRLVSLIVFVPKRDQDPGGSPQEQAEEHEC
jgi:hypothetical protein